MRTALVSMLGFEFAGNGKSPLPLWEAVYIAHPATFPLWAVVCESLS